MRLEDLMPIIRETLGNGHTVRLSPKGTSMLPMLRQGRDMVLLSPLPKKLKKYDLPLYQRSNGQYVLHRIVKADNTYTCIGDNQYEKETDLKYEQMIALVTAFYRDGKKYSVTNFGYRTYCRYWYYSRPLRRFLQRARVWLWRLLK